MTLVTTKEPDPAQVALWNFVSDSGDLSLPPNSDFVVLLGDRPVAKEIIGFKRRPIYAPLRERDLRIGNYLYIQVKEPIAVGEVVVVLNPANNLFPAGTRFIATNELLRLSPALHINQAGYATGLIKKATIGYYLGSAGELPIPVTNGFRVLPAEDTNVVFQGILRHRPDAGYTYNPLPYQQVFEADFTGLNSPGEYRLHLPGVGVSLPFRIGPETPGILPRTYALGLYHQRCGESNSFPFTRHTHEACHTARAEVPTMSHQMVNFVLAQETAYSVSNPRHTAPPLSDVNASLYPFVRTNSVDVSGGHHDAGDYSKYTIDSAQFIHALVFAADLLPPLSVLDNLGLPESGDGISDILQIAGREAAFLAKMQDEDGGFYFLVYPRDRRYEHDVLPDRGDPQVVFPKTTAATAAVVAALAQIASSPTFKQYYSNEAAVYLDCAERGWTFLEEAIDAHGRDGSYQKTTHYGDAFMHDDELAWAAAELYLATGYSYYHSELRDHFDPSDPATRHWGWWRLYEGYGCAIRSYTFATATGRLPPNKLHGPFLAACRAEILAAAEDQLSYSRSNAFGVSFPLASKEFRVGGWFFATAQAFDLVAGYALDPRPEYLEAILANIGYECGNNPLNISFLTGVGWKRQREIVHQYAQNDRRVLPPSGLPLGAIAEKFGYVEPYRDELQKLTFPADSGVQNAYAFYDRWADSFNTMTECTIPMQARGLVTSAFVWAMFGDPQPWQTTPALISGLPAETNLYETITAHLTLDEVDLTNAVITWEAREQEPGLGTTFTFSPTNVGSCWIEAEVLLPDGRRWFATNVVTIPYGDALPSNVFQASELPAHSQLAALYHLDLGTFESTGKQGSIELFGDARLDTVNVGWMKARSGAALRLNQAGDYALARIANSTLCQSNTQAVVLEAMVYVASYPVAPTNFPLIALTKNWNASLEWLKNPYFGLTFRGGTEFETSGPAVAEVLQRNQWHHLQLRIDQYGYSVRINGVLFASQPGNELSNWSQPDGNSTLLIGNFEGWVDEVAIWNITNHEKLSVTALPSGNGQITLEIQGTIGTHYRVQQSTNLFNWKTISLDQLQVSPVRTVFTVEGTQQFFRAPTLP